MTDLHERNIIRTTDGFLNALNDEISWRKSEIISYRLFLKNVGSQPLKVLSRAFVPLLYAHWEGFIKKSSEMCIQHVFLQNYNNRLLSYNFLAFSLSGKLQNLTRGQQVDYHVLKFLIEGLDNKATMPKNKIDTKSTLGSKNFTRIINLFGISPEKYQAKLTFLDEVIVAKRHKIAHGEFLDVTVKSCNQASTELFTLMEHYKTDIENIVVQKSFLKAP